jgi:hypothetical protein
MQLGGADRLHAPDHRGAVDRAESRDDPRDQPAAPDGHDDGFDLGQLLDDLERDGRLPGDDIGMIERRHDGQPLTLRDLLRLDPAIFGGAARHHDFSAPLLHARDLHCGRRLGHRHDRAHAELLGGVGHGLAVIAR